MAYGIHVMKPASSPAHSFLYLDVPAALTLPPPIGLNGRLSRHLLRAWWEFRSCRFSSGRGYAGQSPCHSRLLTGPTALLSPTFPRAKHPPVSYSEPLPPPSASESLNFYLKHFKYFHYKKRLPREVRSVNNDFSTSFSGDSLGMTGLQSAECGAGRVPSQGLGNLWVASSAWVCPSLCFPRFYLTEVRFCFLI